MDEAQESPVPLSVVRQVEPSNSCMVPPFPTAKTSFASFPQTSQRLLCDPPFISAHLAPS